MDDLEQSKLKLDPNTEIGAIRIAVRDLQGMKDFYQNLIGLSLLGETEDEVILGVDCRPLVRLTSNPDGISYPYATGLFHLAILLPNRPELGRWLMHLHENGYPLDGVGDHLVSEALYLSDPEGNGIEMYRDRPRETWETRNGQIRMDTLAVDLGSLIDEAAKAPFGGLPNKTKMGHIHLQVNNIAQCASFYEDILGFDLMAQLPGAGFLSAGGYHHHIGMNTWRSYNGEIAPANALGLMDYEILVPNDEARKNLLFRLIRKDTLYEQKNDVIRVQDPAGIWIEFVSSI